MPFGALMSRGRRACRIGDNLTMLSIAAAGFCMLYGAAPAYYAIIVAVCCAGNALSLFGLHLQGKAMRMMRKRRHARNDAGTVTSSVK